MIITPETPGADFLRIIEDKKVVLPYLQEINTETGEIVEIITDFNRVPVVKDGLVMTQTRKLENYEIKYQDVSEEEIKKFFPDLDLVKNEV